MRVLSGAAVIFCLGVPCFPTQAGQSPEVVLGARNKIPACATPGRLAAFLKSRNSSLRPRFEKIAVNYMQHGETLNVRWDFAFFQMLLETNSLKFTGDVHWSQNNFAGLGATGGGVKGERFASVSNGVKAHLEHLLIYAGVRVDNPVAERTRKVQSWNILSNWRRSIAGPVRFTNIGQKWAPGDRNYSRNIASLADGFYKSYCQRPDPRPELIAEARGKSGKAVAQVAPVSSPQLQASLAAPASLGAATVYRREQNTQASLAAQRPELPAKTPRAQTTLAKSLALNTKPNKQGLQIVNPSSAVGNNDAKVISSKASQLATKENVADIPQRNTQATSKDNMKIASAGSSTAQFATKQMDATNVKNDTQKAPTDAIQEPTSGIQQKSKKCRVWTASYGGRKAIIIRSADASHTNYTVLDVNPGREQQETNAYIAAYAHGGTKIAEFKSQTLALDEAFRLCPDG